MATHSNILSWRMPWTKEPRGLQSTGLQRVRHDWVGHDTHTHQNSIDQVTYKQQEFPTVLEAEGVGKRAVVGAITPQLAPTECSGLIVSACYAPDGYAEILVSDVIVLDSEALGGGCDCLRPWSWSPMVGFMFLPELGDSFRPLCRPPCEHRVTSLQSATWRRALTRTLPHWHPNLRPPALRAVGNSCGL